MKMSDLIDRQAAIDALGDMVMNWTDSDYELGQLNQWKEDRKAIIDLPSAQPDYQEVLGWLLAYHTKSFDLHGRYLPHEVISWLINDFSKNFIAERKDDE